MPADPPTIVAKKIAEISSFDGLPVPGAGATWFPEKTTLGRMWIWVVVGIAAAGALVWLMLRRLI